VDAKSKLKDIADLTQAQKLDGGQERFASQGRRNNNVFLVDRPGLAPKVKLDLVSMVDFMGDDAIIKNNQKLVDDAADAFARMQADAETKITYRFESTLIYDNCGAKTVKGTWKWGFVLAYEMQKGKAVATVDFKDQMPKWEKGK